jgi:hypothetical protein
LQGAPKWTWKLHPAVGLQDSLKVQELLSAQSVLSGVWMQPAGPLQKSRVQAIWSSQVPLRVQTPLLQKSFGEQRSKSWQGPSIGVCPQTRPPAQTKESAVH